MKRTGGKLFQKEDKASEGKGMLSSFEAISTAIGGTVGFGNIALYKNVSRLTCITGEHLRNVAFVSAWYDIKTG